MNAGLARGVVRGWPRRHPVSATLGTAWTASVLGLHLLPAATVARVLADCSTTLPRLAWWPLTLLASGLLVRDDLPVWLLALVLGTAAVEDRLGPWRTVGLLAGVHVGATGLSQALLGWRVHTGDAPRTLLDQLDVGPSYLAVAGLTAAFVLARTLPRRLLAATALAVGVPELLEGLRHLDLAATGHLAAFALALGLALALGARRLRPSRCRAAA